MSKRIFYTAEGLRVGKALVRNAGIFGFIALVLLFGACTGKDAPPEIPAADSVRAGDSFHPDTVKAFTSAGLSLLKQKVSSRDFSLPLAAPESAGVTAGVQSLGALKGKVVFLNFWATWCGPCRAEMPSMEALYKRYKEQGLEVLAVNCQENAPEVVDFMKDNGLSFPAALDLDGKVSGAYGIRAIPTTFLIDREGKIVLRLVGSINWDTPEISAAIQHLLN